MLHRQALLLHRHQLPEERPGAEDAPEPGAEEVDERSDAGHNMYVYIYIYIYIHILIHIYT